MLAIGLPCRRLFLAAYTPCTATESNNNLVVVAVLRDSLCRVIAALHGRLLYVV